MKVFISWSGLRSKAIAEVLRQWLPGVIQAARPYYSPDDITKGTRWAAEISKELEAAKLGIICVTPDNLEAPWIMFEAGALSKNLDRSKVCPILFGVDPTDVKGPLVQFQASKFDKQEVFRVVKMLNSELGELALGPDVLTQVFDMWWPQLDDKIQAALLTPLGDDDSTRRTERDLLEEVLAITRTFARDSRMGMVPTSAFIDLLSSYREAAEAAASNDQAAVQKALRRMSRPMRYMTRPESRRGGLHMRSEFTRAVEALGGLSVAPAGSGTVDPEP